MVRTADPTLLLYAGGLGVLEQFFARLDFEDLLDGVSFDAGGRLQAQKMAGGGEGVVGADVEVVVVGEVVILADAGAADDPGDAAAALVVSAVIDRCAAVVGGEEDPGG